MGTPGVRAREKDSLTLLLGWFSLGLGTAQVLAPRRMCRLIGARGERVGSTVMRLMGLRELAQGVGILTQPRPTGWLWSRVAGDGVDLSLLGLTAARANGRRGRTLFAMANVAAVTVPDVFQSLELSRKRGEPRRGQLIRKAVTIKRPRAEVEQAWADASDLRERVDHAGAVVTFAAAPAGRGTELAVEFVHDPPAGDLGSVALKLAGKDLATELSDDLRRLKQLLETGEIVRSDSTPSGHLLAGHMKQRPAQPQKEAVR